MKHLRTLYLSIFVAALSAACKPAPAPTAPASPAAANTRASASAVAASEFTDRVWRVQASSAVEPGMLYVFLSDGTLVITVSGSTPTLGKWRYDNGALTMIEEGQSYPTDILALDDTHFTIRSHNPGTPVEITLERAAR